MRTFLLCLALVSTCSCQMRSNEPAAAADDNVERGAPGPDLPRASLEQAHRAHVSGDPKAVVAELTRVLTDPHADEAARANALELLERAYAEGKGRIATGAELPKEIPWLRLTLQHGELDGAPTDLAVINGGLAGDEAVDELRLVRGRDGRVLGSKKGAVGYFETGTESGKRYFYLHSSEATQPLPGGAYKIEWTLASGRSGEVTVLVPSFHLDELPAIASPATGAVVTDERPTLRWSAPGWAANVPYGKTILDASVSSATAGADDMKRRWSMWEINPTATSAQIGAVGSPPGLTLADGDRYLASVQYDWRLQFGPVQVGGATKRTQSFSVHHGR